MGSLIRATNLWGYSDLVRELGGDPDALLARFHLPLDAEYQEEAFVPYEAVVRMLEATAAELNCPDFGLRVSRWQGLDILGPIAVIARSAQTVFGALESIARYLYVHSPALQLSIAPITPGRDIRFTYEMTEPRLPYMPQGYELSLANGVRISEMLGGSSARPIAIAFTHDQLGSDEAYSEALRCPVEFGASWCGFELPAGVLDQPIDTADPQTRRIAQRYLDSLYVPETASLTDRVAELTRRLLPTGQCSAEAIAEQLAMHPRTLHRRLAAEGVRCQDILEQERRDQAARYLAEPRLHLRQIAGLIGYAEQSTLNRSCQRWFGKTPRQYRAELSRLTEARATP